MKTTTTMVYHVMIYFVHSSPVDPASSTPRHKTRLRRISPRRHFVLVGVLASLATTTTRTSPPTTVQTCSHHHRYRRPPPPLRRSSQTRQRRATKKPSFAAEPTSGVSPRCVSFVVHHPRFGASAAANANNPHRVVVEHPSAAAASSWSSASWSTDVAL